MEWRAKKKAAGGTTDKPAAAGAAKKRRGWWLQRTCESGPPQNVYARITLIPKEI